MLFLPFFLSLVDRHGVIYGVSFLCVLCWDLNQLKIYGLRASGLFVWETNSISDISYRCHKSRGWFETQTASTLYIFFFTLSAPWSWIWFYHLSCIQEELVSDYIVVGIADRITAATFSFSTPTPLSAWAKESIWWLRAVKLNFSFCCASPGCLVIFKFLLHMAACSCPGISLFQGSIHLLIWYHVAP